MYKLSVSCIVRVYIKFLLQHKLHTFGSVVQQALLALCHVHHVTVAPSCGVNQV